MILPDGSQQKFGGKITRTRIKQSQISEDIKGRNINTTIIK